MADKLLLDTGYDGRQVQPMQNRNDFCPRVIDIVIYLPFWNILKID